MRLRLRPAAQGRSFGRFCGAQKRRSAAHWAVESRRSNVLARQLAGRLTLAVGAWDPSQQITVLDAPVLAELLGAATRLHLDDFGLPAAAVSRLAATVRLPPAAWRAAEELTSEELVSLVRLYVLAEGRFPDWKAGAKSPVITLCRLLRRRGAWPAELSAWIKSNSDNRFLPYGSLADRL